MPGQLTSRVSFVQLSLDNVDFTLRVPSDILIHRTCFVCRGCYTVVSLFISFYIHVILSAISSFNCCYRNILCNLLCFLATCFHSKWGSLTNTVMIFNSNSFSAWTAKKIIILVITPCSFGIRALPLRMCVIASSKMPDIPSGSKTATNWRVNLNGTISGIGNNSEATPKAYPKSIGIRRPLWHLWVLFEAQKKTDIISTSSYLPGNCPYVDLQHP